MRHPGLLARFRSSPRLIGGCLETNPIRKPPPGPIRLAGGRPLPLGYAPAGTAERRPPGPCPGGGRHGGCTSMSTTILPPPRPTPSARPAVGPDRGRSPGLAAVSHVSSGGRRDAGGHPRGLRRPVLRRGEGRRDHVGRDDAPDPRPPLLMTRRRPGDVGTRGAAVAASPGRASPRTWPCGAAACFRRAEHGGDPEVVPRGRRGRPPARIVAIGWGMVLIALVFWAAARTRGDGTA